MHTAPILIVRIMQGARQTGEVAYHGYTTQRFGAGR